MRHSFVILLLLAFSYEYVRECMCVKRYSAFKWPLYGEEVSSFPGRWRWWRCLPDIVINVRDIERDNAELPALIAYILRNVYY